MVSGTTSQVVNWTATDGSVELSGDNTMTFTAPTTPGTYTITARAADNATNAAGASAPNTKDCAFSARVADTVDPNITTCSAQSNNNVDTDGAGRATGAPAGCCEYGPLGQNEIEVVYVADGAISCC